MAGSTQRGFALIIGGVLLLVVAIILADVVIDSTTTALTNASIGSFSGASSVGGLIPLIYFTVVIMIAVAMMGIGARGLMVVALPLVGIVTAYPLAFVLASAVALYAVYYLQQRRSFRQLSQVRE